MSRLPAIPALIVGALLAGGCVTPSSALVVPAGPLAPIVPVADGEPPVECRGVPLPRCLDAALDPGPDPDVEGVERYILTCTTTCTAESGRFQIDKLGSDGVVSTVAQAVYGE